MYKEAVTKKYVHDANLSPFGSLSTISKIVGNNKKILDVGCASGYLAKYCPENEFYGIDGNSEAVKDASKVYTKAIEVDLNKIPEQKLFNEKFDYIVFADLLEHILYPQELLSHFKEYLNEGGQVIISLPNVAIWRNRINLLLGKFDYTDFGVMDRTHLHLYTLKTSKELLENAGYRIVNQVGAAYATGQIANFNTLFKSLFSVHIITTAKPN